MSKKITYLGGDPTDDDNYEITLSAEEINETSTEYSYSTSIENRLLKVERTTDKQEGTITDLIKQTSETSNQVSKVTQTVNDFDVSVKNVQKSLETTNGTVSSLEGKVTDMNFNFSTKGLAIGTTTDVNNSLLDNTGIKVFNYEKLTAIFNYKGSGIEKLIVTGSSQIGYFKTEKSTKTYLLDGTQVTKKANKHFFLKELIEDLEDLEG